MIRWKLKIGLLLETSDETDAAIVQRWDRVEEELSGESIHGDDSLQVDLLETFERLVSIKRRALARRPRGEQEDPNVQ